MRDFRGEEEVDYYGAHVLFLCDQKEEEEKKKVRVLKNTKKMAVSPKKKQSENLKKEPFVGFIVFVG